MPSLDVSVPFGVRVWGALDFPDVELPAHRRQSLVAELAALICENRFWYAEYADQVLKYSVSDCRWLFVCDRNSDREARKDINHCQNILVIIRFLELANEIHCYSLHWPVAGHSLWYAVAPWARCLPFPADEAAAAPPRDVLCHPCPVIAAVDEAQRSLRTLVYQAMRSKNDVPIE